MRGQYLHRQREFGGCRFRWLQQRGLQGRGCQSLQIAPSHLGIGILAGDDLALLGDAYAALHRASGLGKDRLITRAAAAADRSAATVEQAQANAAATEYVDQSGLGLVEFPSGGQKAT